MLLGRCRRAQLTNPHDLGRGGGVRQCFPGRAIRRVPRYEFGLYHGGFSVPSRGVGLAIGPARVPRSTLDVDPRASLHLPSELAGAV